MTTGPAVAECDLVGLSVTGGFAHFPGLATERVQPFESLDPMRLAALLEAAGTANFFARTVGDTPIPPDARTHHLRLAHAGRSRTLAIPEPSETPELARLVRETGPCWQAASQQVESMTEEDSVAAHLFTGRLSRRPGAPRETRYRRRKPLGSDAAKSRISGVQEAHITLCSAGVSH